MIIQICSALCYRDSRRLSIPRARIGNQVQDVYLEETIELRNPAPDYDPRHSSGVLNPAPDYGPEDSPVMRRKNSDPRDKRGNHNYPSVRAYISFLFVIHKWLAQILKLLLISDDYLFPH